MFRSLNVAATGMVAQETKLDTIANNLANANTIGFKRQDAEFEDLLYQTVRAPAARASGAQPSAGVQVGLGTRVVATPKHFTQGVLQQTGNKYDMAVEGEGLLTVLRDNGQVAYTRTGSLKLDAQGRLVTIEGHALEPPINVPPDAVSVAVAPDGQVSAMQPGQTVATQLGQLQLAMFPNTSGLNSIGHNLYEATQASGEARIGIPGTEGRGTLLQGSLEGSNVEAINEMIGLIRTQRAYEINSKIIATADEMLRDATHLR